MAGATSILDLASWAELREQSARFKLFLFTPAKTTKIIELYRISDCNVRLGYTSSIKQN
jgi:hypothetical protein